MENKYYTPEYEEFHVGFEYEDASYPGGGMLWHKQVWDGKRMPHINPEGTWPTVRVKFLDKEDIESLGWKYIGGFFYEWPIKNEVYCNELSNRPLDFRLNFVNHNKYLGIEAYERNAMDWEDIYRMPCKNKSELKKLMQQIGIIK